MPPRTENANATVSVPETFALLACSMPNQSVPHTQIDRQWRET